MKENKQSLPNLSEKTFKVIENEIYAKDVHSDQWEDGIEEYGINKINKLTKTTNDLTNTTNELINKTNTLQNTATILTTKTNQLTNITNTLQNTTKNLTNKTNELTESTNNLAKSVDELGNEVDELKKKIDIDSTWWEYQRDTSSGSFSISTTDKNFNPLHQDFMMQISNVSKKDYKNYYFTHERKNRWELNTDIVQVLDMMGTDLYKLNIHVSTADENQDYQLTFTFQKKSVTDSSDNWIIEKRTQFYFFLKPNQGPDLLKKIITEKINYTNTAA